MSYDAPLHHSRWCRFCKYWMWIFNIWTIFNCLSCSI